jgi:hypothetical protein
MIGKYLIENKWWWLGPIIAFLVLLALLLIFSHPYALTPPILPQV